MARRYGKYDPDLLIAMFRKAATLRNEMVAAGFTDNGGAIHSASRILDLLALRLCYPGLSHINNLRHMPGAEFSVAAWTRHQSGGEVLIEHVAPLRALTVAAIELLDRGASDKELAEFVNTTYRLVLLTPDEALALNKVNRSRLQDDRLAHLKLVTAPLTVHATVHAGLRGAGTAKGGRTRAANVGLLEEAALLGIDVGFSAKRATTGLAWCIGESFGTGKAHTSWAARLAVVPDVKFSLIAIDGPLPPAKSATDLDRGCERTFIKGAFATRCKPGLSHVGNGLMLRSAALQTATDAQTLLNDETFAGPQVFPGKNIVEAFPNAFLGVLIPDEIYRVGGHAKRQKFDWLYENAVKLGRFDLLFDRAGWEHPALLNAIRTERDHERRAAYVCLITAALSYLGHASAIGDVAGGYFWLPPLDVWEPWARNALSGQGRTVAA